MKKKCFALLVFVVFSMFPPTTAVWPQSPVVSAPSSFQPAVLIGSVPQKITARTELDFGVTLAELENGLRVIIQEDHSAPVVAVDCFIKNTGSAFEGTHLGSGISHLVERLTVESAASSQTREQIQDSLDRMGASFLASTDSDMTYYSLVTTAAHAAHAVDLMTGAMRHAVFEEETFDYVKRNIQEEFQESNGNPASLLRKTAFQTLYTEHPVRHPVPGYPEIFQKLTLGEAAEFYKQRYVPNGQVFVVTGDVDTDKILEEILQGYAGSVRTVPPSVPLPEEPAQVSPREMSCETDTQTVQLLLAWPTVKLTDREKLPLDLAANILGQGNSSRLFREVLYVRQLALELGTSHQTPSYVRGAFHVFAVVPSGKQAEACEAIQQQVDRLRDELVTPAELAKAKKQKEAEILFKRQTPEQTAFSLGYHFLTTGNPLHDKQCVSGIRAVTAEEVREAVRKFLSPQTRNQITVLPKGTSPRRNVAASARTNDEIIPVTLKNGVRLLVKRQTGLPMVSVSAITLGSTLTETAETAGLSTILAGMLDKGNARMNALEIAGYFDSIGGELEFIAGRNTVYGSMTVLKDDFPQAVRVLAESLLMPSFPEEELVRVRSLAVGAALRRKENPMQELMDTFAEALPQSTPYSIIPGGTQDSLNRITRDDLVFYHRQYVTTDNLVVAVFGEVNPQEVFQTLDAVFGQFPRTASVQVPLERNNQLLNPVEKQISSRRSTSLLMMGYPIVSIRHPQDIAALTLLDAVMSGYDAPGGWLYEELQRSGLAHTVHAELLTGIAAGYFLIYAQTAPEKLDEVKRRINDNLAKVRRGEITQAELTRAKEMVIARHARKNTTLKEQSLQSGLDEIYGLGFLHDRSFAERLRAVTREDVSIAAKKYFTKCVLIEHRP
ncbi:MAG: insulinase family protein [Planctomycetaceae bacterium]|jgi:zinc protease|nr:insulinase family protein [Planctomycetaceae bacterium]